MKSTTLVIGVVIAIVCVTSAISSSTGQNEMYELPNNVISNITPPTEANSIQRINFESTQPRVLSEQVIISITNYDVNSTTGLVVISGATQHVSFNEPILPVLFIKKVLPDGSNVSSIRWDEASSHCIIVDNEVPIAGIASSEVNIEGSFSYNGFYPANPYANSSSLTLGGGGSEINIVIMPVQYNSQTGKTKIWTRMVFDIQYSIPDTDISVINLAADKQQYSLNDNVTLNIALSNAGEAKVVDLNVILREFNRDEHSVDIGSIYLPDKSNVSGIYTINLQDIPLSPIKGGVIEAELIVIDIRNDEVLASEIIILHIDKLDQRGDTKISSNEEIAEIPKGTFQLNVRDYGKFVASLTDGTSLCSDIDLIFILDCSGSMDTRDAVLPDGSTVTRLDAAKFASKNFIDLLPRGRSTRVGVVSYESYGNARIVKRLTTDFGAAKTAVDSLTTGGSTSIGEGIEKGINELQAHGSKNKRIFLLLTDGKANDYPSGWSPPPGWTPSAGSWTTAELYALYEAHVALIFDLTNPTKTYTVGVGYQTSINENLLKVLASSSGGKYFFAGTTSIQKMFKEIAADICAGDVEVLILANFQRLKDIGYSSASVNNLKTKLQDLADNNPNGRGVLVDLDTITSIKTAYTNWNGNEGDIAKTNALVQAIDNYIENLKQNRYPKIKYVILVGSHEVLPMKARPDDYTFTGGINEKHWSNKLPKKSGYFYDIYHAGTNGHYLTDTIYADLSYKDSSADHELTPELAVGRLVETPTKIIKVIDAYIKNKGKIPKNRYVSMASYDYLDGGTQAKDNMIKSKTTTDSTLVKCAYASSKVPPLLNTKHDTVYFAGHGNYNWITTKDKRDGVSPSNDGFMAGNSATYGDTSEVKSIDGAVIITSGCHNGVNFGNKKYHKPDAGTKYSEFPEEFAKKGVVAYLGATGYTAISSTKCKTDKGKTGYSEKLATNVVHNLVTGEDIGSAFTKGANDYYKGLSTVHNYDKRVLAIPTLYGIPTYKDPVASNSSTLSGSDSAAGYSIKKMSLGNPQPNSEQVAITITNYSVDFTSGLVIIPGATQAISFNEPIVPVLFVEKTLPYGADISVTWNKWASENTVVTNDIPIAGIACSEVAIEGKFSYEGFYPVTPYVDYSVLTLGGGGSKVGIAVNPVQYNSQTGETKIWTKMVFDIEYDIPETGISVVGLSTDKDQYYSKENVMLSVSILNKGTTRSVDLNMIMRDADTSEELATVNIGSMGLAGGTTSSGTYSIDIKNIPQLIGKTIEGELLVLDPNDDNILASACVTFKVISGIEKCKVQITSHSSLQDRPSIVYANGNYYAAYQSHEKGYGIFIKKFDSQWNFKKKVEVVSGSAYYDSPSLVFANNKLYVAYISNEKGATANDYDVIVKEYDPCTLSCTRGEKYLTSLQSCQDLPALYYCKGGYFYLAYQSWERGNGDIFIKKFGSNWNQLKKVQVTSKSSYQDRPSLIYANGYFYVAYHSKETGDLDIFVKRLDANLNLDSWKKQITSESSHQSYPFITFVNNQFTIVYASTETGTLGIYMKKYDSNWNFIEKTKVVDDNSAHERRPSMTYAQNNYWIAYVHNLVGSDDWNIFTIIPGCVDGSSPTPTPTLKLLWEITVDKAKYSPGDYVHLTQQFTNEGEETVLIANPITTTFIASDGSIVLKEDLSSSISVTLGAGGQWSFGTSYKLPDDAPEGYYDVKVSISGGNYVKTAEDLFRVSYPV